MLVASVAEVAAAAAVAAVAVVAGSLPSPRSPPRLSGPRVDPRAYPVAAITSTASPVATGPSTITRAYQRASSG